MLSAAAIDTILEFCDKIDNILIMTGGLEAESLG